MHKTACCFVAPEIASSPLVICTLRIQFLSRIFPLIPKFKLLLFSEYFLSAKGRSLNSPSGFRASGYWYMRGTISEIETVWRAEFFFFFRKALLTVSCSMSATICNLPTAIAKKLLYLFTSIFLSPVMHLRPSGIGHSVGKPNICNFALCSSDFLSNTAHASGLPDANETPDFNILYLIYSIEQNASSLELSIENPIMYVLSVIIYHTPWPG